MSDLEVHLVADFEAVRTHPIRTIKRQTALLTDALHALENGNTAVVEEFVNRVRDALDAELLWLSAQHPSEAPTTAVRTADSE